MAAKRRRLPAIPQMNDVQLLAHLLAMSGTETTSARELSRSLLDTHHSLTQVLSQPSQVLLCHPELGENAAAFLLLLPALMGRYTAAPSHRQVYLDNEEELKKLLWPYFCSQNVERVCAFFLNDRLQLITSTLVAQGGSVAVSCSVRRVLELALNHDSKGIFLAHNHPDGLPFFSKSDLLSTDILFQELSAVGIPLLDHFLLAGGQVISLRRLALEHQSQGLPLPIALPKGWFPKDP